MLYEVFVLEAEEGALYETDGSPQTGVVALGPLYVVAPTQERAEQGVLLDHAADLATIDRDRMVLLSRPFKKRS